jgi:hypothetical protein
MMQMPVNQFSSFSAVLNATFQRLGFSSTASPQSNSSTEKNGKVKVSSDENAKGLSEKDTTHAEEAADSGQIFKLL